MNTKLPGFGTTIFTVMSNMAADHGAVNLAQGFPDFSPPAALVDAVCRHLQAGRNQYAPMPGAPALLEQVGELVSRAYGCRVDADRQVTITSGATEALYSAITALVHPGDEVIVFDPAYDSYVPAIRLSGGRDVHIPLTAPGFAIDWDRINAAITPRTRMLVLNSPHNPTGAVLGTGDIDALKDIIARHDLWILSDEVYEHIIFDGRTHHSMLRYPELAARSLVVSSFGKTFHATGWKIGYCVAPAELTTAFRQVHQFVQFCVATPLQLGLADYLREDRGHWQQLGAFYQERRDRCIGLLQDSRLQLRPSAGTYFQLADYSAISTAGDVEFTRWLTVEKGVAAIPVSVFYDSPPEQHLIRLCFAKSDTTLEQAAEKLCAI